MLLCSLYSAWSTTRESELKSARYESGCIEYCLEIGIVIDYSYASVMIHLTAKSGSFAWSLTLILHIVFSHGAAETERSEVRSTDQKLIQFNRIDLRFSGCGKTLKENCLKAKGLMRMEKDPPSKTV